MATQTNQITDRMSKEDGIEAMTLDTSEPMIAHSGNEHQSHLITATVLVKKLSVLDRLLTPAILLAMVIGAVIGEFVPNVQKAFDVARFDSVSVPIAIGLIVMMWPILTKVQYERLPQLLSTRILRIHLLISLALNWILGPFLMLALAWATLPDAHLAGYRTGVIMVGLARCIAMVMVWNQLACGNSDYCAVLVLVNSALQMALYAPLAVLFVHVIGREQVKVTYGQVAISVLIYLGIPLFLGLITRASVLALTSRRFLEQRFLPISSPVALIGLLYTVIVLFAYQSHNVIHNIGRVFRVMVPLVLYFVIMWFGTFMGIWKLSRRDKTADGREKDSELFGYEMAVVQAFTSGSNNFELAIAVCIAVWGVNSDQALAATIGPLVEVPVLLVLTSVALFLRGRIPWTAMLPPDSQIKIGPKGEEA